MLANKKPVAQLKPLPPASNVQLEPHEDVDLKLTSARVNEKQVLVHACITPGPGTVRPPADIVCVVDISGSMGSAASVKGNFKQQESYGISMLDIVKHAVKTVVHSLDENDRFSLVVFSKAARVEIPLSLVKDKEWICDKQISCLSPEGSTNIWDGLVTGLRQLKSEPGRISSVLLLTDGLPTIQPAGGELAQLKKYIASLKNFNTIINTFGFGYDIDTELLLSLAIEGNGMHSFIPDASFVGTAFVNCISNILVTMGCNAVLEIEPKLGTRISKVLGSFNPDMLSRGLGAQVNLCTLQYGQTKDLVIEMTVPAAMDNVNNFVSMRLRFTHVKTNSVIGRDAEGCQVQDNIFSDVNLHVQQLRLDFVGDIPKIFMFHNDITRAYNDIAKLEDSIRRCPDLRAQALLEDVSGQAKEAVALQHYNKWGKHYLPSLGRAHLLQQCNNFKDPGVQVYGGQMFQTKRDEVDDIFMKLPPPKPSIKITHTPVASQPYTSNAALHAAPFTYVDPPTYEFDMSMYNDPRGACIAGECKVLLASGQTKLVQDIKKGDIVMSIAGPTAVESVVKTLCMKNGKQGIADLVAFPGGLRITPYHPVQVNNEWQFPIDLHAVQVSATCDAVFNFVLNQGHIMIIEGEQCVTLGHGFNQSSVISHPYFGTQRIIEDLQKMNGWENGLIELNPANFKDGNCMKRDKNGLVCGFAINNAIYRED